MRFSNEKKIMLAKNLLQTAVNELMTVEAIGDSTGLYKADAIKNATKAIKFLKSIK